MSHAVGEVWSLTGQRVGWFEYNGTVDVVCGRVFPEEQEMDSCWRTAAAYKSCSNLNDHKDEYVILYSHYGDGFHWLGKVCWKCMAISEGLRPNYIDGPPFKEAE